MSLRLGASRVPLTLSAFGMSGVVPASDDRGSLWGGGPGMRLSRGVAVLCPGCRGGRGGGWGLPGSRDVSVRDLPFPPTPIHGISSCSLLLARFDVVWIWMRMSFGFDEGCYFLIFFFLFTFVPSIFPISFAWCFGMTWWPCVFFSPCNISETPQSGVCKISGFHSSALR